MTEQWPLQQVMLLQKFSRRCRALEIFDMLLTRHVVKQLESFERGEDDKKYMGEWAEKVFSEYCLKHTWRDEFG
jgi:hypothetical protein